MEWRGFTRDKARGKIACVDATGGIEDVLVDWRATTLLIRSDQPLVSPRKVVIGEFAPMDPPRIADEVRVCAVGCNPSIKSFLVGDLNCARIDLFVLPLITELASVKALTESPDVTSWITECQPNNLGVGVGKCAFGRLS